MLPLSGIRVVEFSHMVMGPYCGMVLADLGADVVKIEPADAGDRTRHLQGFAAAFFPTFNRNKRAAAIDLKSPGGRDAIRALVAGADVVIENYAPDTMQRLGLDYATLAELNPRLVYCSLKGFLSGPFEHRLALDEVIQHMSGLAYMTGLPGKPMRTGASVVDILGAMFGVVGIQAALRERETTGRGQEVRSALFESACALMAQHMAGEVLTGEPRRPMGDERGAFPIYDSFATRDGRAIFVAVTSDQHWARFCDAFDQPDLLADPDMQSGEDRITARDRLVPHVAALIATMTSDEASALCDHARIPFAVTSTPSDLFENPHLATGDRMVRTEVAPDVFAALPGLPLEMGTHQIALRTQPPRLGEHTGDVLREAGFGDAAIAALADAGAITLGRAEPVRA